MIVICPDNLRFRNTSNPTESFYDSSKEASQMAWHTCLEALGQKLQDAAVLHLMVGIPGSGKSTWLTDLDPEKFPGHIFFDATLTRRVERELLIQMAHRHDVEAVAEVFFVPLAVCVERNGWRSPDRMVPFYVLSSMLENLRKEPVTLEEGFSQITAHRYTP